MQTQGGTSRDLVLASCITLLAVCLLEVALHLCGARFEASLFQIDPVRNYSFRPDATGWSTEENDVLVHINHFGNRDRARSLEAAPGTFRIAVLGSSTTAGLEVEQQQTYTALLERDLNRAGAPVEVLNFAVSGYGPAQDFYTLSDQVWRFHPQIVMDEVSLKQYVLNSSRKFSTTAISYPYFQVAGNSAVQDGASQKITRPSAHQISISNHLRNAFNSLDLLLLAASAKKDLAQKLKSYDLFTKARSASIDDPRSDPWRLTLVPPVAPEIEQGWEILERLTLMMRTEAEAHAAEFWVIASDDAFQVNPDPKVAEALRVQMKAQSLNYGDNRFDQFLSAQSIKHIHLEPSLLDYVHRTGAYLHGGPKMTPGEGHWNVLGHRVVAEIIEEDLRRKSAALRNWQPDSVWRLTRSPVATQTAATR